VLQCLIVPRIANKGDILGIMSDDTQLISLIKGTHMYGSQFLVLSRAWYCDSKGSALA